MVHCELKDCSKYFMRGGRCIADNVRIDKYGEIVCYDPSRSTSIVHEQFDIVNPKMKCVNHKITGFLK